MQNGDDRPGAAVIGAPVRSGKHAVDILKGFDGILHVDGFTGYSKHPAALLFLAPKRV